MENVEVFNRPIGNYKTIHLICNGNKHEYMEVTKYPDGDIMASIHTETPDIDVILTIEQLEKLLEELK